MRWMAVLPLLLLVQSSALRSQETLRPVAVLEPGPYFLDWGFEVRVTPQGRVLAHAPAFGDETPERLAIWNGLTGELLLRSLEALSPETSYGYSCGGTGSIRGLTLWSNRQLPPWNPETRRFQWDGREPGRIRTLDEDGQFRTEVVAPPLVASLQEHTADFLEVVVPGEPSWFLSLGRSIPQGLKPTPIQRMIVGKLGFQEAIADRCGRWAATIWEGAIASSAPNRRVVPYRRDGNPRWLVWHQGSSMPVMDVPRASILGDSDRILRMALNGAGDRIVIETGALVAIFDPMALMLLGRHQGRLVEEIPGCNQLLIQEGSEPRFTRVDLATGLASSSFTLPESLDPEEPGNPPLEEGEPIPDRRRSLGDPIAFSPDGRYMVTPRLGRQGAHWDGLVVWDLGPR